MISLEEFSEMLEVLYAASLDREQWPRFLALVGQHTQASAVALFNASSRGSFRCTDYSSAVEVSSAVDSYNAEHRANDPFRGAVIRSRPGVYTGEQLIPSSVFLRSQLYTELLAPFQLRYVTVMAVAASLRRFQAISVWRTSSAGPLENEGARLLNLLFPHVRRSLEIAHALGVAHQRLAGAQAIADASPTAAFVVTKDARVVHGNEAAHRLVLGGNVLELRDGILAAASRTSRDAFRNLVRQTGEARGIFDQPDTKALSIPSVQADSFLHVLATPLPKQHREQSVADVLVLVTDPNRANAFPDDILRSLYGLTAAEIEVANGLLMGYTLSEIAALRKVNPGTVRVQLKTVLSKTATSRQSDLVRKLMTLPQPAA